MICYRLSFHPLRHLRIVRCFPQRFFYAKGCAANTLGDVGTLFPQPVKIRNVEMRHGARLNEFRRAPCDFWMRKNYRVS